MAEIAAALSLAKTAFDTIRGALGLLNDVKDTLPEDVDKATIQNALEKSEHEIKLAEAEIAKALGYRLCKCAFPPHIMLKVGTRTIISAPSGYWREEAQHSRVVDVHECPACGQTDAAQQKFHRNITTGFGTASA